MNKIKTKDSVRGYRINCIRFEQCPLCYGCRAFDSSMVQCLKCEEENAKIIKYTELLKQKDELESKKDYYANTKEINLSKKLKDGDVIIVYSVLVTVGTISRTDINAQSLLCGSSGKLIKLVVVSVLYSIKLLSIILIDESIELIPNILILFESS